jgi:hypothetical protein
MRFCCFRNPLLFPKAEQCCCCCKNNDEEDDDDDDDGMLYDVLQIPLRRSAAPQHPWLTQVDETLSVSDPENEDDPCVSGDGNKKQRFRWREGMPGVFHFGRAELLFVRSHQEQPENDNGND